MPRRNIEERCLERRVVGLYVTGTWPQCVGCTASWYTLAAAESSSPGLCLACPGPNARAGDCDGVEAATARVLQILLNRISFRFPIYSSCRWHWHTGDCSGVATIARPLCKPHPFFQLVMVPVSAGDCDDFTALRVQFARVSRIIHFSNALCVPRVRVIVERLLV